RQRKFGSRRSKQAKLWSSRGALCVYAAKSRSPSENGSLASRRSDLAIFRNSLPNSFIFLAAARSMLCGRFQSNGSLSEGSTVGLPWGPPWRTDHANDHDGKRLDDRFAGVQGVALAERRQRPERP